MEGPRAFISSCIASLLALVTLGVVRWHATGEGIIRSIIETVLIGCMAGCIAYGVGVFFR